MQPVTRALIDGGIFFSPCVSGVDAAAAARVVTRERPERVASRTR